MKEEEKITIIEKIFSLFDETDEEDSADYDFCTICKSWHVSPCYYNEDGEVVRE